MNRIGFFGDIMGIEWNSGGDILEDGVENHRVVTGTMVSHYFLRNRMATGSRKPGMIHGLQHLHVTT